MLSSTSYDGNKKYPNSKTLHHGSFEQKLNKNEPRKRSNTAGSISRKTPSHSSSQFSTSLASSSSSYNVAMEVKQKQIVEKILQNGDPSVKETLIELIYSF